MDDVFNYQRKEEDDYYFILGCDELSTVEQINTEYKARVLACHPDKHPDDPTAGEKFAKLQKAKEILSDENKRKDYDHWRGSGIAIDYSQWVAKKDSLHTSMHWATKKKKEPMLEGTPTSGSSTLYGDAVPGTSTGASYKAPQTKNWVQWESDKGNDMLQKFRNYEI